MGQFAPEGERRRQRIGQLVSQFCGRQLQQAAAGAAPERFAWRRNDGRREQAGSAGGDVQMEVATRRYAKRKTVDFSQVGVQGWPVQNTKWSIFH
jgi:hypothetical protein